MPPERSSPRRPAWNAVRRSLERDALLAAAGQELAAAVDDFLAGEEREVLRAALERYRQAESQVPGPIST